MIALRCAPCALITRVVLCASPFPATVVGASGAVCVTVQGFVRAFEAIGHTRLARTHRLWGERASGPDGPLRSRSGGAEVVGRS